MIPLYINTPPPMHHATVRAIRDWNHGLDNKIRIAPKKQARIIVRALSFPNQWWQGYTWYQGARINIYYNTLITDYDTKRELQQVACHELGHALGLWHNTRTHSCMNPNSNSTHPDASDREQLRTGVIVKPVDGNGTVVKPHAAPCIAEWVKAGGSPP